MALAPQKPDALLSRPDKFTSGRSYQPSSGEEAILDVKVQTAAADDVLTPRRVRCLAALLLLLAISLLAGYYSRPILGMALRWRAEICAAGLAGKAAVLVLCVVYACALLPSTGVQILLGFIYGFEWGCLLGVVGISLGAVITFSVARCDVARCGAVRAPLVRHVA